MLPHLINAMLAEDEPMQQNPKHYTPSKNVYISFPQSDSKCLVISSQTRRNCFTATIVQT